MDDYLPAATERGTCPSPVMSVIPNQGYWNGTSYQNTFLGLSPAVAWAIRVVFVDERTASKSACETSCRTASAVRASCSAQRLHDTHPARPAERRPQGAGP